jgi:excisionase family DNA binding protein
MPVIGYNIDMGGKLYSTKEAARILGLSPDHVKRLARDSAIKAQKLGHDWVVLSLDYKRKRKPKIGKETELGGH